MLNWYLLLLLFAILNLCLLFLGFVWYSKLCIVFWGFCMVCRGFVLSVGALRNLFGLPPLPPVPHGGGDGLIFSRGSTTKASEGCQGKWKTMLTEQLPYNVEITPELVCIWTTMEAFRLPPYKCLWMWLGQSEKSKLSRCTQGELSD